MSVKTLPHIIELFLACILILSHIILLKLSQKKRERDTCPGYLDNTYGQCTQNGKLYIGFIKRKASCDPTIYELKRRDIALFASKLVLQYITDQYEKPPTAIHGLFLEHDMTVYKGIFYFLLKPFLTILPTDFGQNYVTPYGTPSFFADYISCIPETELVCKDLIGDPNALDVCKRYFKDVNARFANPILNCPIENTSLYSNPLYVELGLLGAMTITPTQAIVIHGVIPSDIGLKYWSFIPYLADRYENSDKCNPYNHIYFCSLTDPFNIFTHYTKDDLRFAIIISINPQVSDAIHQLLRDRFSDIEYIHRFDIPSGSNSMIIEPSLINPNNIQEQDRAFNYKTDRLALLFRMNVINPNSPVFEKFKLNPHFETYCVDLGNSAITEQFFDGIHPALKQPYPLYTDESFLQSKRDGIQGLIKSSFSRDYNVVNVHIFKSLLSTFAPLNHRVYFNEFTYKNGRQAIQMASNANGDNPDAWYKISQPQCLSMDDILLCICVNHTALMNSVYCNINVLDKQMGRGIASIEIFEDDVDLLKYPFYAVIVSRNSVLLQQIKNTLHDLFEHDIFIYDYYIETGDTMNWNVPMCHQILFIERTYLNTNIPDSDGTLKYYREVTDTSLWSQMTRPDGNATVDPIFIKLTKRNYNLWYIIIIILIILILLILIRTYN